MTLKKMRLLVCLFSLIIPLLAQAEKGALPDFSELTAKVGHAVVNISTTRITKSQQGLAMRDPLFDEFFRNFFGVVPGQPQGNRNSTRRAQHSLGSGFVIDPNGDILTNNHVIEGADEIVVKFSDDSEYEAKLVGRDPKTDLAVIQVKGESLPHVDLGNSDALKVGEWVLAIGNPFGLGQTVTAGIVSAKGRVIGAGPYDDFIQTDASINPGNSGGPLFNLAGEVVGINTAIIESGQGIGFAIPVNMAKTLTPQLIATGKVSRGWLGVALQDLTPELAESYGFKTLQGALIAHVEPGGPADRAGIEPGDIITAYDGQPIKAAHNLPVLVAQTPIGNKAVIEVLHNGKTQNKTVTITESGVQDTARTKTKKTDVLPKNSMGLVLETVSESDARILGLDPTTPGVLVKAVEPGSLAEQVGVFRGDVIASINGVAIDRVATFERNLTTIPKGGVVRLLIVRDAGKTFVAFRKVE